MTKYDTIEMIRQKVSMAQKISLKDKSFARYVGAELSNAEKMALIDLLLDLGLTPGPFTSILKFYRLHLDYQRKAFFSAVCSEISKLGFMLGLDDKRIKVGKSR